MVRVIHAHQGTRADSHRIEHDHDGDDAGHTHVIHTHEFDIESGLLDEYWERYEEREASVIALH